MPMYSSKIRGSKDAPRVVRAKTAAQAHDHIVEVEPLTAEGLADAIAAGATIEIAGEVAPPPASADKKPGDDGDKDE